MEAEIKFYVTRNVRVDLLNQLHLFVFCPYFDDVLR